MTDYSKGKIYKIVCNITGEVYYGSTCETTVARRLTAHISKYKQWKRNGLGFYTSFPIIDRCDYNIFLVELYPCGSRDELKMREGFYQSNNKCVNKRIENNSSQLENHRQYCKINAVAIAKQKKGYNQDHREHFNELQRIRRAQKKEFALAQSENPN